MNPQQFQVFDRIFAMGASARRLMHWVLVVVIALNLVTSPFHAHHHEGGPEGYGTNADHVSIDEAGADAQPESRSPLIHQTVADNTHVGHSVSALRGASVKLADVKPGTDWRMLVSILGFAVLLDPPAPDGLIGWHPQRERIPILSFRTVPPGGRAPPPLHV